jgi:DNA-binding transcriptional regulator YdaS (Cro superfamily)
MDLKTYLSQLKPDARDAFAEACGTTVGHLRNVAYECRPCGEKLAIAIERETRGEIRCEHLRPDVDWAFLRGTKAARQPIRA